MTFIMTPIFGETDVPNDNVMMVLVRFSSFHNLDASGLLDRIDGDDNLDACLRSGTISSWNLNRTEV